MVMAMSIDELLEKDRQLAERKELDNGDDIDDANDDDDNSSPNSRLSYSSLSMEARELLRSIADQMPRASKDTLLPMDKDLRRYSIRRGTRLSRR